MTTAYARCAACRAVLAPGADWCSQCFVDVRATVPPEAPSVPARSAAAPRPSAAPVPDDALATLRALDAADPVALLGSRLVEPRLKLGAVVGGGLALACLLVLALTLLGAVVG
ncbi:hypothetical protein [Motilibacter aurantiacus]|uniref:hypothetical protein n=1 Tax=Motilibacter aurantiacus TaxID=2714955 RepID=UPI00140A4687|nr:hypothetical protein [Motilibacter aurantiacus]NHC45631.1 hypothetical protein [Motilibacter aurantiacus]